MVGARSPRWLTVPSSGVHRADGLPSQGQGRRAKPELLQTRLRGFRESAVGRPRVKLESTRGEPLRARYAQAREPGTWSRRPGFNAPMAYRVRVKLESTRGEPLRARSPRWPTAPSSGVPSLDAPMAYRVGSARQARASTSPSTRLSRAGGR